MIRGPRIVLILIKFTIEITRLTIHAAFDKTQKKLREEGVFVGRKREKNN